jgi:hypothetical protein
MGRDFEPRGSDSPLSVIKQAIPILDKYREGVILDDGLDDAKTFAELNVVYYRMDWVEEEYNEWLLALSATVRTENPTLDLLRKKIEKEGHDYIEGAASDQDPLFLDGQALLNLARSF